MSGGSQFAPGPGQSSEGNYRQVNSSNFWDHLSYLRGGSPGDAAIVNMLIQPVPPAETQSQHHSSQLESRNQGQSQQLSSDRYDTGSYNAPERPSSKYNNNYPFFPASQTINGLNQSQSSNNTILSPNTITSASYNYHNSVPPVREITCPSCGHKLGSIDSISKPTPVPVPVTNGNHYNNSAPHESSQVQKSGEWKWVSEPSVLSSSWSTAPPPPPPPQENQFQNTSFTSSPSKPPRPNPKDEVPQKNPTPYRTNFNPASNNSPQLNHQLNQNNKQDKRAVIRTSGGHGPGYGRGTRAMSGGKSQANESYSEKSAGCDDYESQYTSYKPNIAHRTLSELLRLEDSEENRYPSSNTNRSHNNTPRPRPRPRPKSNQRENLFLNDWNLGPGRRQIGQSHATTNRSTGQQGSSASRSYRYGCEKNHNFDGNHLAPTTDGNPRSFSQSHRPIQRPWEAQPMSIPPVCQAGREEIDGNEPAIQNSRTYLWDQHVVQNMKECWERFLQLRASEDDDAPENSNFPSHQQQRQHQEQQSPQKHLAAKSKSNDCNFWELEPEVRRHGKSVEARSRATWTCHCACRMRDEDREAVQKNNEVEFNSFQDIPSHSQSGPSHQFQSLKKGPCSSPAPARSGKTDTGSSRHSSAQVKRSFLDIRSEFQAAAAEFIRRQEERQQINDNDEGRIRIEHEKDNLSKASEISSEEKVELWMERNSSLGSSCDNNSSGKRHGKGRGTSTTELQPQHQYYYAPKPKSGNAEMCNVENTDATRVEILERATATSDSCGSEDMEDVQGKPNQYFSKSSSSNRDGHQVEMGTADNCVKAGISISTSTEVDGCEEAESPSRRTVEKRSSTDTTFLSITDDDDALRKSSASSSETSSATSNSSSSSQGPPIPPLDDDQLEATSESWGWSSWFSSS